MKHLNTKLKKYRKLVDKAANGELEYQRKLRVSGCLRDVVCSMPLHPTPGSCATACADQGKGKSKRELQKEREEELQEEKEAKEREEAGEDDADGTYFDKLLIETVKVCAPHAGTQCGYASAVRRRCAHVAFHNPKPSFPPPCTGPTPHRGGQGWSSAVCRAVGAHQGRGSAIRGPTALNSVPVR